LECSYNPISNLNVSGCTALLSLSCSGNQLISLNVLACTALTSLSCAGNQLTNLNVSACTALTSLFCCYNQLTSLDPSACPALTYLDCRYNNLSALDVSSNSALSMFFCGFNQLPSINVSANSALNVFYCDNNQLTSLNVSANTALNDFDCSYNLLTSLNVKNGNNQLMNFNATYNPYLSCIEVDSAAWSDVYWWNTINLNVFFSEDCGAASISDDDQSVPIFIYPNPTTGSVYLSEQGNIALFDFSGKLLLEQKNTNQCDLSEFPAGMYFLQVGDNLKERFKVIKE